MRRLITGLFRRVHHRTMLAIERRTNGERRMLYAFATAAAAVFIAAIVFDASSADMGLNGRPTVQRASGWAW